VDAELASISPAAVMSRLAQAVPVFAGLDYQKLAQIEEQWPVVGRGDLFYGGTTYENKQGLGAQLPLAQAETFAWPQVPDFKMPMLGLMAFPVTRLYDQGATLMHSTLLHERIGDPYVVLNAADAARLNIKEGALVRLLFTDHEQEVIAPARLETNLPERVALVPLSFCIPINAPRSVEIRLAERATV
jgi:NADH-quinone oxidoreductase subunit G